MSIKAYPSQLERWPLFRSLLISAGFSLGDELPLSSLAELFIFHQIQYKALLQLEL